MARPFTIARATRQPPPDYTQRAVKLRLFLLVAAIMLAAAVIERAVSWQRDDDTESQAPSLKPQASSPLPRSPAPFDPVERAWDQGWQDVFSRLSAEEQGLLFAMLHTPRQPDRQAEEKLIQAIERHWNDHQSAAFQSVADLKGDDQTQWIDVLRQVNARFTDGVVPALRAIAEGREPNPAEQTSLTALQNTLVALTRAQVQDDTVVFRPAEREIWFHEIGRVLDADSAALKKSSLGRVAYLQLYKQPAEYRGQIVTVAGSVRLAYRVPAPANHLGVKEYCVYWLHPAGGPDSPILVYALDAPTGFPEIGERDGQATQSTGKLREDVEVTGVFFKRCAYAGQGGTYSAPLLIAKVPDWHPPLPASAPAQLPVGPWELAAFAIAALTIAICAGAVLWKRSSRRYVAVGKSGGFVDLGQLTVGPTPQESIRELERQARGEGAK